MATNFEMGIRLWIQLQKKQEKMQWCSWVTTVAKWRLNYFDLNQSFSLQFPPTIVFTCQAENNNARFAFFLLVRGSDEAAHLYRGFSRFISGRLQGKSIFHVPSSSRGKTQFSPFVIASSVGSFHLLIRADRTQINFQRLINRTKINSI